MQTRLNLQIVCPAGVSKECENLLANEAHLLATYRTFSVRQRADIFAAMTVIGLGLAVQVVRCHTNFLTTDASR